MLIRSRKKVEVGKWHFVLSVSQDFMRMESFSNRVSIFIFKPTVSSREIVRLRKDEYKGFMFECRIWFPVVIDRWR